MASALNSIPSPPQQPGLRPFMVCDRLPQGCVAYPVTDNRHQPLLRSGEWVVVDPDDREPEEGELFMLQWQGGPRIPQLVEVARMKHPEGCWVVGARHRGANATDLVFGMPGDVVGDFPYRREGLIERFLGKVVGILEPAFDEPMRELA